MIVIRLSSDVCGYPVTSIESGAQRQKQRLDIYKRQNSEFNRLQSNNINYSAYENINDEAPNQSAQSDISTAESRHFGGLKKRPCVPVYPNYSNSNYGKRGKKARRRNDRQYGRYDGRYDQRTLYDLNFYFLGYQPNQYVVNPGTQTVSGIAAVDNNNPVSQSQSQYDHNGGFYDCEPNPFYRPPHWVGSGNGALNDDPNRPSYLGLLGQGLFDFINGLFGYGNPNAGSGGYDTPVSGSSGAVLNDNANNENRPVFEINVPDAIAALVNDK